MIEFFDSKGVLGTVTVTGDDFTADRTVQSIAESYKGRTGSMKGFEDYYRIWSNGYVSSREVGASDNKTKAGSADAVEELKEAVEKAE